MTKTKLGLLVLVALACGLVLVSGASAYDRQPIAVSGLYADGWSQSTTAGEKALMRRYPGIYSAWCTGALINGNLAASSFVDGTVRFWDKLACGGYTQSGKYFSLIYDAKGRYAFTIYRLSGVTSSALYSG
jgi:hypothetical protein